MPDAVVIVLRRGASTMIIRRGPGVVFSDWWAPPSGRVEPGETPEHAVIREAREELGLEVVPQRHVWTCPTDDGRYRLLWWLAEVDDHEAVEPDPREVAEARWVTAEEYLDLEPTFEGDEQFYREVWPNLVR